VTAKKTIALAGILALLIAAYFVSLQLEVDRQEEAQEKKRFFQFEPERVQRVTITRRGEQTVEAIRRDGRWHIVKPHAIAAADPAWDRIAKAISSLKNERTIEETASDLETYELADPRVTLSFMTDEGMESRLRFGAMEPSQRYRFAVGPEGRLTLVNNDSFREFDRSLLDLRNRFLAGTGSEEVASFAYTRFKEAGEWDDTKPPEIAGARELLTVRVVKGAEGEWRMTEPIDALANSEKVNALIQEIRYSAGEDYVDDPEALMDYGLDPAGARLVVTFADGSEETVYFGDFMGSGESRRMFVKQAGSPAVFTVDAAMYRALPSEPMSFRDHRLLTKGLSDIRKFEYRDGDERIVLELDDERGWVITEPVEEETDQQAVSAYIAYLGTVEALSFPGDTRLETGLDDPAVEMTVHYDGDKAPATMALGGPGPDDGSRFAMQDTGALVLIEDSRANVLEANLFQFRPKRLVDMARKPVDYAEVTFEDTEYVFEKVDDKWLIRQPDGKVWERQADMELLLSTFRQARVASVIPLDEAAGLANPILRVTLKPSADADEPVGTFVVGDVTPAQSQLRYGHIGAEPEAVLVEQRVIDRVREALRGVVDQN